MDAKALDQPLVVKESSDSGVEQADTPRCAAAGYAATEFTTGTGADTNMSANSEPICVKCDQEVSDRQRERESRHEPRKRATS